jgi:uncharacterized protein
MTTVEKIKEIETEMARTQKNKVPSPYSSPIIHDTDSFQATSFHLGQLKAKLAKLKRELLTPSGGGGGGTGRASLASEWADESRI